MKTAKEILARSVVLQCISDRTAMEESILDGVYFSKWQREKQRKLIWEWLNEKGYTDFVTEEEKAFFLLKAGHSNVAECQKFMCQSEAIGKFLWVLCLTDKLLLDYSKWDLTDTHPTLQIIATNGNNSVFEQSIHSFQNVLECCIMRSEEEIYLQNKIAMLWCWRVRQHLLTKGTPKSAFNQMSIREQILEIFGEDYIEAVDIILKTSGKDDDFAVGGKDIKKLRGPQLAVSNAIAESRYHAFEWIVVDDAWDEVELNT